MNFELCLFCVDPSLIKDVKVDSIVVDWENKGKNVRQNNFDTQINAHSIEDLKTVRKASTANIICRINQIGVHSEKELQKATEFGADEILIPMVRSTEEVKWVLDKVENQIKVGILIETNAAIENAKELAKLPLRRVYIGLNDLAIENRTRNIFLPILNGTIAVLRDVFSQPFGFGGLTLPENGSPIPCHLLIGELARLGCSFSFLRRSFLKDTKEKDHNVAMQTILNAISNAKKRSSLEIENDHKKLLEKIYQLEIENCPVI